MATLDNAAIIRKVYEAFDNKDFDTLASYATADARMTVVPFGVKVGIREDAEAWARAFPDGKCDVTNIVAQGDYVVAEFTGRGTHNGVLKGPTGEIQPTGRSVQLQCVEIYRMRNGKITEARMYFDVASLLNQLGLGTGAPAPQARPTTQPRH